MKYLVNAYGAYAGGIVRVHEQLCMQLYARGALQIVSAPIGQHLSLRPYTLSSQTGRRAIDLMRNVAQPHHIAALIAADLAIDVAPCFSWTKARRHAVIVHDLNFLRPEIHQISNRQHRYRTFVHQRYIASHVKFVCVSDATRDELLAYAPSTEGRTTVLPLPVDHAWRGVSSAPVQRRTNSILTFGHARNKGVQHLLSLLALRPDWQLRVVCSAQQWRQYWSTDALRLGVEHQVTVLDGLSDKQLQREYLTASIFCMLSSYEGYGLPAAEALSLGTPVLHAKMPSLAQATGGLGWVAIEPQSVDQLARDIDAALDAPAIRWQRAMEAKRSWSWTTWTDELELFLANS